MLSGNYIKLDEIIAEVYRDTGASEELPYDDMVVWAFEAINLIGANNYYINKYHCANIENYRVKVPCDFHQLHGVLINGCVPVYNTEIGVNIVPTERIIKDDINNITHIAISEGSYIDGKGLEFLAGFPSHIYSVDLSFSINNSYITANVDCGTLDLFYRAIPTDEEGYPMIPEDMRYRKAVKSYLIYRLDYIMFRKGKITGDLFKHSEREWEFYVGSAANKAKMPDIHLTQAIKNSIMRLKSDDNLFYKNFLTSRETKYIK